MATLVFEVQDKKLKFFKNVIRHFSFVTIQDPDPCEDTDEQVIENIRAGMREMRLVEEGKAKSRPAREFLNEL